MINSLVSLLPAASAFAGAPGESAPAPAINSGDTAWMLVSTALVLLMTPGLALFYGGFVRSKNVASTIMQSFIALAVVSLTWYAFGYSLAFAPTCGGWVGGLDWSFLSGVTTGINADYAATIPHSLFMTYQGMFAVITPALITGAFAERMKFSTYLVFLVLWSLIIYSPVAHWVWGVGGVLRSGGLLDFAGGVVVHQTAGFSALAAALVFGKRLDYGKAEIAPHNVPMIVIGTSLLWFGWFGFNAGSALASGELAVAAFNNTHFAVAAAALAWVFMDWATKGAPTVSGACVGAVVGAVAITPASGFVPLHAAPLIGALAAVAANLVAAYRAKTQVDDSLDVFACHGVGGLIGCLMTGLLASKAVNAAGADGGAALFLIELKGSLLAAIYSFAGTFGILKALDAVMGLRPSRKAEAKGLDEGEHHEKAYSN